MKTPRAPNPRLSRREHRQRRRDRDLIFWGLLLLVGGLMGLVALQGGLLGVDRANNLRIGGYLIGAGMVMAMLIYKERRGRLGPEAGTGQLGVIVFVTFYFGSGIFLVGLGWVESRLWRLLGAAIASVVGVLTVMGIEALIDLRAGDGKLSETEEPGAGFSPAKESENAGE